MHQLFINICALKYRLLIIFVLRSQEI